MRILVCCLIFFSEIGRADTADISDKARLRLYDGGMDEQPLQVQANLYNPRIEEKTGEGENAPTNAAPAVVEESPGEE